MPTVSIVIEKASLFMSRPIQARIDCAALRHNYLLARQRLAAGPSGGKAWAVVKANAYGHGLMRAATALGEIADGFALLDPAEAVALRQAGFAGPLLLLEGFFDRSDLWLCARHGLTPAVHRLDQLRLIGEAGLPAPLPIYLKLNTGMNRLGFTLDDLPAVREALSRSAAVGEITLMTHFSDADGMSGIAWQIERFEAMRRSWPESSRFPVSLSNSAALLRHAPVAGESARPGIMLYGSSPFADASAASLGLSPAMTLSSQIIAVDTVGAGERVGYGGTFTADRPMRLGIVACGYADGYPRHAPTGTPILVGGRRTRTLGRVSMDMLACDLTDLPEAGVGSAVVLWGEGLPVEAVAAAAGTIGYELLCALAPRVPVVEVECREK